MTGAVGTVVHGTIRQRIETTGDTTRSKFLMRMMNTRIQHEYLDPLTGETRMKAMVQVLVFLVQSI